MPINKVILVGHVGKDPEVRYLDNNTPVASFTLATNETYKNKNGEKVTNTEWHNIVLWRGLAQVAEKYVKKGNMLFIEGKIRSRSWDDKDGIKRYTTEIIADNMQMLDKKESGPSNATAQSQEYQQPLEARQDDKFESSSADNEEVDDLPF
jgi:single-strand DNA-binding protein